MFLNKSLTESTAEAEKRLNDLEKQNSLLRQELRELYEKLGLSQEEVHKFASNPENFSQEDWESMEEMKREKEIKIQQRLDAIRNPVEAKKKYASSKQVAQHWIFVR